VAVKKYRELSSSNAILINSMPLSKISTRKTFSEIKKEKLEEYKKTGRIGALKINDPKLAAKLATLFAKENANAIKKREKSSDNQ